MKSVEEIKKEISRLEIEVILNTNRKAHFEESGDDEMVAIYDRMNHDYNAKIEVLQWVTGEEE